MGSLHNSLLSNSGSYNNIIQRFVSIQGYVVEDMFAKPPFSRTWIRGSAMRKSSVSSYKKRLQKNSQHTRIDIRRYVSKASVSRIWIVSSTMRISPIVSKYVKDMISVYESQALHLRLWVLPTRCRKNFSASDDNRRYGFKAFGFRIWILSSTTRSSPVLATR